MRSTNISSCSTGDVTPVPDVLDCDALRSDTDGLDGTTESSGVVTVGGKREIYGMDFDDLPNAEVSGDNCILLVWFS